MFTQVTALAQTTLNPGETLTDPVAWPVGAQQVEADLSLSDADVADPTLTIMLAILTSYDGVTYTGSDNEWQGGSLRKDGLPAQPLLRLSIYSAEKGYPAWVKLRINPSRSVSLSATLIYG